MRRTRGFTLIEILISIAILVVGVAGVIALFPSSIEAAARAVDDTYAASVAQSVVDTFSAVKRDGRIYTARVDPTTQLATNRYILFDHDGVLDQVATPTPGGAVTGPTYYSTNCDDDYVLLLPKGPVANKTANFEPIFLYPSCPAPKCPAGPPTVRTAAALAGPIPSDLSAAMTKPAFDGSLFPWVRRVYKLGRYRQGAVAGGFVVGDVRAEYLPGIATGNPDPATLNPKPLPVDMYPQFSFAFTLRRTKTDTNADRKILDQSANPPGVSDEYSDALYELRIMVFRNFDDSSGTHTSIAAGSPIPRTNLPVREFVTVIDVGPSRTSAAGAIVQPMINGRPLNQ